MKKSTSLVSVSCTLLVSSALVTQPVWADTPQSILDGYAEQAKAADASFSGFSAERGQLFFANKHGNDWSCASCHTSNPADSGKHAKTGKVIKPIAPAINPQRFTRLKKVEKWFRRNCNDVLARECTAAEKGDLLSYFMAIKP